MSQVTTIPNALAVFQEVASYIAEFPFAFKDTRIKAATLPGDFTDVFGALLEGTRNAQQEADNVFRTWLKASPDTVFDYGPDSSLRYHAPDSQFGQDWPPPSARFLDAISRTALPQNDSVPRHKIKLRHRLKQ